MGDGDRPTASGGQPVVDLGPSTPPGDRHQPDPVHDAPPNDKKPDSSGPGDELPPPQNPDASKGDTPASPGPPPPPPPPPPPQNTGDPVTPPQKSEPDPGPDGTPTDVPIFLGPSNPSSDKPSPGDIGPSSDPPWNTDPHGNEKEFEGDSDPSCGGIFSGSLINILSNNGGDGGDASSGKATSIANGKGGSALSQSGHGGIASGGSVTAVPALINIFSNNGGNGGKAKSGDSFSYGSGGKSVSQSGPGGDASGGSVKNLCSRRLPVSRTSTNSESGGSVRGRSGIASSGSKKKWSDPPAAYTGKGGNASGGSVKGNGGVVNVWSGNGGNGGKATSGSAFAHGPGAKAYSGPGGNAAGGDVGRREPTHSLTSKKMPYPRLSPREEYVSARHSTGKFTPSKSGGDHYGGLVDVGSGNGGDGGDASSGNAYAYTQKSPAYSGPGGQMAGGSVSGGHQHKVWKRDDDGARDKGAAAYTGPGGNASGGSVFGNVSGLIDLFSGNGGDGGDASSGSAYAYGSGAKAFSGPGGDASGGSINEGKHGREYGSVVDLASGNGVGGDPGSGGATAV